MHRNTMGESPCVTNVKKLCQKDFRLYVVHSCGDIEVGGDTFENLLWDVPDFDEPGVCPLQIISNTMVSTCMRVMLVVMLFIT